MTISQESKISHHAFCLVLSSPSGAGKSSIAQQLIKNDSKLFLSISITTRPQRPREKNGTEYHFLSEAEFIQQQNNNSLLESAKVFDYYYGTPKQPVENSLRTGKDVLFDIDWQGSRNLVKTLGNNVISVFILPPSLNALEQRLHLRQQDNDSVIKTRMKKAEDEISHWNDYDYIIVNHDIQRSIAQIQAIINAERTKKSRLIGVDKFVKNLNQKS